MKNFYIRSGLVAIVLGVLFSIPLIVTISHIVSTNDKIVFIVCILLAWILSSVVVILSDYFLMHRPIKKINNYIKSIKVSNKGERIVHGFADKDIKELIINVNNIAKEFESLEEMRSTFVANASHELRSPLTSIQGFLYAMIDGTISRPQEREKYLKQVYDESKRLEKLINEMLDISRIEAGKYKLEYTNFDINQIVRRVAEKFSPTLVKDDKALDLNFESSTIFVNADCGKIQQVLINLLDNAIKYSPSFSKIKIGTFVQANKAYVYVEDKGFGIGKKEQSLIWDKFYMSDKARTPQKKSTGLGLSIVKNIIDAHKERIDVISDKGKGAKFIFTLKLSSKN